MEFNITFGQAKTRVDDFVSYMQSQGYKKSTQKRVYPKFCVNTAER